MWKNNRKAFTGYYGQERLSAKLPWKWDRQGQHAIVGAIVTLAAVLGALVVPPVFMGMLYVAFTYVFVQYEVTETEDINDWAWPDLKGWMIGIPFGLIFGAIPWFFV